MNELHTTPGERLRSTTPGRHTRRKTRGGTCQVRQNWHSEAISLSVVISATEGKTTGGDTRARPLVNGVEHVCTWWETTLFQPARHLYQCCASPSLCFESTLALTSPRVYAARGVWSSPRAVRTILGLFLFRICTRKDASSVPSNFI